MIPAAVNGGEDALADLAARYQNYIRALAARPLKDEYGNTYILRNEIFFNIVWLKKRIQGVIIIGLDIITALIVYPVATAKHNLP